LDGRDLELTNVLGENAVANGRAMADWHEERKAARLIENLSTNFHQYFTHNDGEVG